MFFYEKVRIPPNSASNLVDQGFEVKVIFIENGCMSQLINRFNAGFISVSSS